MTIFNRLQQRESDGQPPIQVAVTGAGLIGRGMVRQINLTPAMRTALIVNRTVDRAVETFALLGHPRSEIVVSDRPAELAEAISRSRPAVTSNVDALAALPMLDAVVEVTGAVEYGARVALNAIENRSHIIMMNAETDATVGCALRRRADQAGVVYTNSDGDQPGVLKRLFDYVAGIGLDVVAAFNCKGFMDVHATPDTIRPWAEKQNTSLPMTTAFTDGTKMNIENAVLANATGLMPQIRGMHGIRSDLEHALRDCMAAIETTGIVDYTLGGDFGGGVFIIGRGDDPTFVQPLLQYLKMGPGPEYLFFRGYHLCHFETPITIAEAVLDHQPTIAPLPRPVTDVVAIAKRNLAPGDELDGIGGYTCYGEIDRYENCRDLLPMGMTESVRITAPIRQGDAIALAAVEFDDDSLLAGLRREQDQQDRAGSLSQPARPARV